jgi:1,4-dihydroxy-2-naphthoate octaprenyltransferase
MNKKVQAWLSILIGLFAFIAYVYSGGQYNRTIIPFTHILSGSLVAGLAVGSIRLKYSQRMKGNRVIWQQWLWVSIVYGSLMCALFFWTNIHFSKPDSYQIRYPIVARFETYRYHVLYVAININGIQKDIPIQDTNETEIKKSNFLVLTFKTGFWGFPFIVNEKLTIN